MGKLIGILWGDRRAYYRRCVPADLIAVSAGQKSAKLSAHR
jgi:hypothetical protein